MTGGKLGKTCLKCASPLPKLRRKWCSSACSDWFFRNHVFRYAKQVTKLKARQFNNRKIIGYKCALCSVIVSTIEIDHIIRAMGTHAVKSCLHHLENLQALCIPCHRAKTKEQR